MRERKRSGENERSHARTHIYTRFDLSQRLIAVITILKYISNTLSIVRVHVLSLDENSNSSNNGGGISTKKVHFPWLAAAVTAIQSLTPPIQRHFSNTTANWTQISGKNVVRTYMMCIAGLYGKKGKKIIGANAKWMRKREYARLILNYKSIYGFAGCVRICVCKYECICT